MHSLPDAGLDLSQDVMEIGRWNRCIFGPAGEFWPELNFTLSKVTARLREPTPGALGDAIAAAQPYLWQRSR